MRSPRRGSILEISSCSHVTRQSDGGPSTSHLHSVDPLDQLIDPLDQLRANRRFGLVSVRNNSIYYVLPDAKTQSALLIREAFTGYNVASIARSMDTSWPAVNRLKNPGHWPTLKLLERALRAAGKQLVIGMQDRGEGGAKR